MASKYWIKLYHEILYDPKMIRLPEILWARCVKLFLLAGDYDQDGLLPSIEDIAIVLRIGEEEVESDLIELQKVGIMSQEEGMWAITKWGKRQGPMPGAERIRRMRQSQSKADYQNKGPGYLAVERPSPPTDTETSQESNDAVTDRYTDIDKDIDKEEKKIKRIGSAADILRVLSTASGMVAFPPKENERIEQIWALLDQYGEEAVTEALKLNFDRWINTKSKSGLTYKRTNFGWVDWAQEELAGGSPGGEKSFIERLRSGEFADG